ncbi:MAG: DUF2914 domain-containing protein [Gemmatimonadetes bacterium]|nr:DUF2914 domain-containing protein [Gemmatimonadota bacterium]NIO31045.1 DUF2914 domain-containing protein [Gemmatimonadota bacterium]
MRRNVAPLSLALLFALAAAVGAQQQMTTGLEVAEAVITTAVVDRQPTDSLTTVAKDIGTVFCWMRITGAEGEIQVDHVWYKDDTEVARVRLRVAGSNWRTWSSKNIDPMWTGSWRVDIVGPDGAVLQSVPFTVG